MLRVRGCVAGSDAAEVLKDGDLVLAVNGQPVTSYGHVEDIVAACSLSTTPHLTPASDPPSRPTASQEKSQAISPDDAVLSNLELSDSAGKAGSGHKASACDSDQQQTAVLIKAARPTSPGLDSQEAPETQQGSVAGPQEGGLTMPQVALTIFRAPRVEEVRVQLGREDGLGTCRLIHWCGAMLQVRKTHYAFHLVLSVH